MPVSRKVGIEFGGIKVVAMTPGMRREAGLALANFPLSEIAGGIDGMASVFSHCHRELRSFPAAHWPMSFSGQDSRAPLDAHHARATLAALLQRQ